MAAIEDGQAGLAARLDGAGGAEDRLQATAAQLLGLIRDKNATLETALAGLDQLRTRMRTLEQIGDAAEARGLFDRLGERLEALESAQAAAAAALEGRLAGLAAQGDATPAILEKLTALHAQKDAAAEATLGRLGPLEQRLAKLEGAAPGEAVARLAARLEALGAAQGATQAALAGLKAEAGPVAELAERLSRLHAQKDALAERLLARLDALEAETAGRDPGPALAALAARIAALEASGESPVAELGEKLAGLHAQKDAALAAVLDRLQPLEARLQAAEAAAVPDPAPALAALAVRLEAAQAARAEAEAGLQGRLAALEAAGSPVAELGEKLAELQARKDAAVDGGARPAAAARGAAAGGGGGRRGPRPGARPAGRAGRGARGVGEPGGRARREACRAARPEGRGARGGARPAAAARGRAAGAGARHRGPRPGARPAGGTAGGARGGREPGGRARREARRAAGAARTRRSTAVLDRLQPLEARLQGAGGGDMRGPPSGPALDRARRRAGAGGARSRRPGARWPSSARGSPSCRRSKDAAVTAVLDRLQPLEARLQEVAVAATAREPALDRLGERLAALGAALEAAEAGLAARLAAVEQGLGPDRQSEDAARAEAQAIATQLIAMHAAAAQTELFADRLALLEASLPRLSVTQSLMMQALERQAAAPEPPAPVAAEAPEPREPAPPAAPDPLAAFRDLPRIVSLHQK